MDAPLPLPPLLLARPPATEILARAPLKTDQGTLHAFDPVSGSAPSCPDFSGVQLYPDALSREQARKFLDQIEKQPFSAAQSGKLKQHAGAKINFNKRRMKLARFRGLPESAKRLEALARDLIGADPTCPSECVQAFADFTTTDFFALRYIETEGSNLDFHRDDRFGYGEAILDISLDSDSVLTFIRPRATRERTEKSQDSVGPAAPTNKPAPPDGPIECVRVPLPARSIAVLYGAARFEWEHAILAYDIRGTRTSITLRTLSDTLRQTEDGQKVLKIADTTL
ncbi:MAG: hypothetical protein AB8G23_13345 [Myxococcota bacterium]